MSEKINLTMSAHAIISAVDGEWDKNDQVDTTVTQLGYWSSKIAKRYFLAKYGIAEDLKKREILGGTFSFGATRSEGNLLARIYAGALRADFDPETVTYRNYAFNHLDFGDLWSFPENVYSADGAVEFSKQEATYALKYGAVFYGDKGTSVTPKKTAGIVFGDTGKKKIRQLSINGVEGMEPDYAPALSIWKYSVSCTQPNAIEISLLDNTSYIIEPPALTAVKLRLRVKGETTQTEFSFGAVTELTLEGNMIPAGAKPQGTIEMQVAVEDNYGGTDTTPWIEAAVTENVFRSFSPGEGAFVNRFKVALFGCRVHKGITLKKFRYRKKGAEDYTEADLNDDFGYIMPANTITDGAEYECSWTATDRYNATWESKWIGFTTVDMSSTARPLYPVGSLIDSDEAAMFRWAHIISTGSEQTKADLQKSADGETWTDLVTVTGAETSAMIAANTFTSGTWYWRVRTYNADGAAGEWSGAGQFIAIATPSTPIITIADTSPKPTIKWQTNEQTAYEISLDGESERYYGTDKTWTSTAYLPDGEHTVAVRVQNEYGRWSRISSVVLNVVNVPGAVITLTADEGELWWETDGDYDHYLIYRDLEAVGRTTVKNFTDALANGGVRYQIRGCYNDSNNYGLSNTAAVTVERKYYEIYDMENGTVLTVRYCGLENQQITRANSRGVTLTHVPGYAHPVAERSEFYDEAIDGEAVFFDDGDVKAFESLAGRLVCILTPQGSNYIGILNNVEITAQGVRTDASFKLTCVSAVASYAATASASFEIDLESGHLIMTSSDNYDGPQFRLTDAGHLGVTW